MHDVRHISVYIAHPPAEVYEFASDPRNLPRWAAGLARSEVRRDGVTPESGMTIHNTMRVVPNGEGTVHVTTEESGRLVAMGQVSYRLVEPWPGESESAGRGGHDADHRG